MREPEDESSNLMRYISLGDKVQFKKNKTKVVDNKTFKQVENRDLERSRVKDGTLNKVKESDSSK